MPQQMLTCSLTCENAQVYTCTSAPTPNASLPKCKCSVVLCKCQTSNAQLLTQIRKCEIKCRINFDFSFSFVCICICWIRVCVCIVPGRRVSTFVMIDFFDFESQPTKLHSGLLPNYNMATTFKVWYACTSCLMCVCVCVCVCVFAQINPKHIALPFGCLNHAI